MRKAWRWTKRVGLVVLVIAAVIGGISLFLPLHAGLQLRSGRYYYINCTEQRLFVVAGTDSLRGRLLQRQSKWWRLDWKETGYSAHWQNRSGVVPSIRKYAVVPGWAETRVLIPIWPAWALLLVVGIVAIRRRAIGRAPDGVCFRCRYDLRGLPDGTDVCPECGAAIASDRPKA